jgi:hypothetical protein
MLVCFPYVEAILISASSMQPPDWNLPFEIMCDASDYAVGVVLGQRKEGKVHAIYYASKTLNEAQVNYATMDKELLAVVFTFEKNQILYCELEGDRAYGPCCNQVPF